MSGGKVTRRTWLKALAAFSAVGMPLMLASTIAEAKASKAAVHYRDYPSGMRMCQNCKFFISTGRGRSGMMGCPMGGGMMGHGMMGAGACQLVEGRISPMGYCGCMPPWARDAFASTQRGRSVFPIRNLSMACAAWRPSRMAQTTSDWPRRMSPAANTFGREVR
jgi:hypothetical protein